MRAGIVGSMLLVCAPAVVEGQVISAADLLDVCTRADMNWIDFCNGFFQAVHDAGSAAGEVCAQGATRTNLVEAFEAGAAEIIASDPPIGGAPGIDVARRVLGEAFPCR